MFALSEQAVIIWGVDPLVVGEYTPYELGLLAKHKKRAEQLDYENLLILAWHTEAFARQKKLPRLNKLLKDARKKNNSKAISKGDTILKAMAAEKGVQI